MHKISNRTQFSFDNIEFLEIQEEGCEGMIADYERASMDWIYIKYIDQIYIASIKKSLQRPLPSKYT